MPSCANKYANNICPDHRDRCKENGDESCFKPYPPRMTEQEFTQKQAELLKDIPEELKGTLSYMAYERGHSAGYEEVICVLQGLVSDLHEPLQKLVERVSEEAREKAVKVDENW